MESLAETGTLVERSALVRSLVHSLGEGSGSGALLIGAAGTGKTVLAKAVTRELKPRGRVIGLTATAALAAVPFGVLARCLAHLPVNELDSHAAVVASMMESLRSGAGDPLFIIDDAHCLDPASRQLLARAAATGAARLLAVSRPGPMIPDEFLALWGDGLLAKHDVPPLSRGGTHQLCERILRAEVSPWVSAVFHDAADGNPLMLTSLIQYSRSTGALALRRGVWFLVADPVLAGVPAADLIGIQLRSMSPQERTAAAIVALAGPLGLGQIIRFSGPRAVDSLQLAGMISISAGRDRTVRPASRIMGEIIRNRVPAATSAVLRSSVLPLAAGALPEPGATLNRIRWSLDCGAEIPPRQLLEAAAAANAALDVELAERAATAVREPGLGPEASLQLAYSHYIRGGAAAARRHLEDAWPLAPGRAVYLAALLAARLGPPAAVDLPPRPLPGGAAAAAAGGELAWATPQATGLATDIILNGWDGRYPEVSARLHDLVLASAALPEVRIPALSQLAELLTAQGLLQAGLHYDHEAWRSAAAASRAVPLLYEDLLARHCLNLIRAGSWDELAAVLEDYAGHEPRRLIYTGGMLHLMRGFSRLRQGRMRESFAELNLGSEELLIADPMAMLPFTHALAAYAAAAVGQAPAAREHAQAYYGSVYREPRTLRLLADAYCLAAEPTPEPGGGRGGLRRLADEARSQGLRGVETDIRRLALRGGDVDHAEALAGSSSAVDGPEARMLEAYARAVAASDAEDLIHISDEALAAGHSLLSLEAAQQAERFLEYDPDRWRLPAVRRRVHLRLVEAGMATRMELVQGSQGVVLTAREAQILRLVASGAGNTDIAASLCLSPRTVEGHLSRIFAKLGVSRRTELLADRAPVL